MILEIYNNAVEFSFLINILRFRVVMFDCVVFWEIFLRDCRIFFFLSVFFSLIFIIVIDSIFKLNKIMFVIICMVNF